MKKALYLFLALLLPGLIFVFLKYAGRNEFAIPVFYGEGVQDTSLECGIINGAPYYLPDVICRKTGMTGKANVLLFPSKGLDVGRLRNVLQGEQGINEVVLREAFPLAGNDSLCGVWKKCIFLVKEPRQAVLFDDERRIRGYYDLRNRDEEDRLRVELKILLKKY